MTTLKTTEQWQGLISSNLSASVQNNFMLDDVSTARLNTIGIESLQTSSAQYEWRT